MQPDTVQNYLPEKTSRIGLTISAVLVILLVGSVYISQLIFQEIAKSFAIDVLDARFVFSLSCFAYAISFFIYGPLSDDKISTQKLVLFGCVGTVLCLVLSVYVQSYIGYLLVMSLIGFFAAAVPVALFAYTAKNTSDDKLAQSMGIMISASIVGIIFSRSMVAILTDYLSWEMAFIIYALMIIGITFLIPLGVKKSDYSRSSVSIKEIYLNAAKLLLNKVVVIFLTIGFLLFFVYLGISSFLTFYLKDAPFYLSSTALGWLNFAGISAIVGAMISGRLLQYISKKTLLLILLSGVSLSIVIIGYSPYLLGIAIGLFSLFMCVFGLQPIVISILNQIVPINLRGAISSLYLLSCLAGGSIGTYLLGVFWEYLHWNGIIVICFAISLINIFLTVLAQKLIKK
ncbi:MFS transporter [Orbus sturtevantii]|uniref:MFS transporter n=1 Tax=Orbus sturtevantii TaxID=3074109 RepID=UPI00370D944A